MPSINFPILIIIISEVNSFAFQISLVLHLCPIADVASPYNPGDSDLRR